MKHSDTDLHNFGTSCIFYPPLQLKLIVFRIVQYVSKDMYPKFERLLCSSDDY